MAQFDACLNFTLSEEGGFGDTRSDSGNWTGGAVGSGELRGTNWGISAAAYPSLDIRNLTRDQAGEIYQRDYWAPMQCDTMPLGLDLMVFDEGVNAGIGESIELLQKQLGVDVDGVIGPITRLALRGCAVADTIKGLYARQGAHYRGLSTFPTFGRGWLGRLGRRYALACQMAGIAQ
ncbi:MAG: glycosyl hydrolase 108 family protein [Acetobacteraceae bacterium]|nr:glycosyl hydrolase 108 family protein [Acetobacteraceae bacterium]